MFNVKPNAHLAHLQAPKYCMKLQLAKELNFCQQAKEYVFLYYD